MHVLETGNSARCLAGNAGNADTVHGKTIPGRYPQRGQDRVDHQRIGILQEHHVRLFATTDPLLDQTGLVQQVMDYSDRVLC
jgi:hypothetical protein